jgi:hypothetical protein
MHITIIDFSSFSMWLQYVEYLENLKNGKLKFLTHNKFSDYTVALGLIKCEKSMGRFSQKTAMNISS